MPQRNDADTSTTVELSPMVKHCLMLGARPQFRCRSWVAHDMLSRKERALLLERSWQQHGDALTREAQAFGFTPAGIEGDVPVGAGVARWASAFRLANEY